MTKDYQIKFFITEIQQNLYKNKYKELLKYLVQNVLITHIDEKEIISNKNKQYIDTNTLSKYYDDDLIGSLRPDIQMYKDPK